jgi:hypothetical protein
VFEPRVGKLAASGDVAGLIALLGRLDKKDVQARQALIAMGEDAVPALLSAALRDEAPGSDMLSPRAAAARTVLVMIGEPTLRAVGRLIMTSDDRQVVADAARILQRTALELHATVSDDVKAAVEEKTGTDWEGVIGEAPDHPD